MNTATSESVAGKYLTVVVAGEAYGIDVVKVREIIRLQKITPVPGMPTYLKGVINLRGRVIPIVDLRIKFGLAAEIAERTCIVVVQVEIGDTANVPMGLIVDAVEEVVNLSAHDIELPPEFGVRVRTDYLLGMATVKGQVKMLLEIDRVVSAEMVQLLAGEAGLAAETRTGES
jgi:purine-binding chemotaxis protein CheW